jgi:hypothetical protein
MGLAGISASCVVGFVDMNRGEAAVDGGYGARLLLLFSLALNGLAGCMYGPPRACRRC